MPSTDERAQADVELLLSAYPDEISCPNEGNTSTTNDNIPLNCRLQLDETSHVDLEFPPGYPERASLQIKSYRSPHKKRIDAVVQAIRSTSAECAEDQLEAGFACCAAALETWQQTEQVQVCPAEQPGSTGDSAALESPPTSSANNGRHYDWISGENLLDRKSTFQAHACRIETEEDVQPALQQILDSHTRFRKATHNMLAWRVSEKGVLKHDNDDDGEDAAGSRLAHLLAMRQDDGVLVVVSRWFGGIKLGPKRFSHISNVAREVLVALHEKQNTTSQVASSVR